MTEEERKDLRTKQFRFAQKPQMWLATGDDLLVAAEAIVLAALRKVDAYKKAEACALAECERIAAASGTGEGSAIIDADVPDFMPAFLIYGYAIENFLKGLIVLNDASTIKDETVGIPAIHALTGLAATAGVPLSFREEDNLERLTVITTWSGRYPVAKNVEKWQGLPLDRAAIFHDPLRTIEQLRTFSERIRQALAAHCPRRDRRSTLFIFPDPTVSAGAARGRPAKLLS
jgi:hypothetical protein